MPGLEHYRVGDVVEVQDASGGWIPGVVIGAGVGMPVTVKTSGPIPVAVTNPAKIRPNAAGVAARIPGRTTGAPMRGAFLLGGMQHEMVLVKLAARGGAKLLVDVNDIEID